MSLLNAEPIFKPFHYPWAYDAWKKQQQIHWLPEAGQVLDQYLQLYPGKQQELKGTREKISQNLKKI